MKVFKFICSIRSFVGHSNQTVLRFFIGKAMNTLSLHSADHEIEHAVFVTPPWTLIWIIEVLVASHTHTTILNPCPWQALTTMIPSPSCKRPLAQDLLIVEKKSIALWSGEMPTFTLEYENGGTRFSIDFKNLPPDSQILT